VQQRLRNWGQGGNSWLSRHSSKATKSKQLNWLGLEDPETDRLPTAGEKKRSRALNEHPYAERVVDNLWDARQDALRWMRQSGYATWMFVMGVTMSCVVLDTVFSPHAVICGVIGLVLYSVQQLLGRQCPRRDVMMTMWLVLTICHHCTFGVGFVMGHRRIRPDGMSDRAAAYALTTWMDTSVRIRELFVDPGQALAPTYQMYSRFEPRYGASDDLVVALAFIGVVVCLPLCALLIFSILWRHPFRYPLQLATATVQLQGCALHFAGSLINNSSLTSTNKFLPWNLCYLLWALWIIPPALIAWNATQEIVFLVQRNDSFSMADVLSESSRVVGDITERDRRDALTQKQMKIRKYVPGPQYSREK